MEGPQHLTVSKQAKIDPDQWIEVGIRVTENFLKTQSGLWYPAFVPVNRLHLALFLIVIDFLTTLCDDVLQFRNGFAHVTGLEK